jgi:hypothetical protein
MKIKVQPDNMKTKRPWMGPSWILSPRPRIVWSQMHIKYHSPNSASVPARMALKSLSSLVMDLIFRGPFNKELFGFYAME